MRKFVGEYDSCLKKLYGSLRKRFKLDYEETLEEVDKVLQDEDFKDYPVILISNDDLYSREFIEEINGGGEAQSFGFYREGEWAYKNVAEVREMAPKLIDDMDGIDKFLYISVDVRSYFRLNLPGTICIKQGRYLGKLSVDIIKTRKIISNEIIRGLKKEDFVEFNNLLNNLYMNRWQKRSDIFDKGYKLTENEVGNLCRKGSGKNSIVCVKDGRIVGFIIYGYEDDGDNRAFNRLTILTIKDIYVDDEYRRQGIATRMYEEVLKIIEKFKSTVVKFKVWDEDFETKMFVESLHAKSLYSLYELEV